MPEVCGTELNPDGTPQAGILIEVIPVPSTFIAADGSLVTGCATVRTDDAGEWCLTLTPTEGATPDPSVYKVRRHISCKGCTTPRIFAIEVPDEAGPLDVEDLIVPLPDAALVLFCTDDPVALAALADPGSSLRAARCDHVHPLDGIATDAEIAAAVAAEAVLRAADVDAEEAARIAADAAHVAAVNPHAVYQTEAEGDARYGQLAAANTWLLGQTFTSAVTVEGMRVARAGSATGDNTALGVDALLNPTYVAAVSGDRSTAVGYQAGMAVTLGVANTFLGARAGIAVTTGNSNVALGYDALGDNVTGSFNTMVGTVAGGTQLGSNATCIGYHAGIYFNAAENVFVGYLSGAGVNGVSVGARQTAVGSQTLVALTTGTDNTALGYNVLQSLVTGSGNTAVGANAGNDQRAGQGTFIGYRAGFRFNATGNTFVGYQAGYGVAGSSTGTQNTGVGTGALLALTTGTNNVALGESAGAALTTAVANTLVGYRAGFWFTTSGENVFMGFDAGLGQSGLSTGVSNVAVGTSAGRLLTTANFNVLIGHQAGQALTSGGSNIFLGTNAGNTETTLANTFIAGSSAAQIDDVYFGKGKTHATATAWTLHGTDGTGADKVGGGITFAAGRGTGAGAPGSLLFQTSTTLASSSTLQTLVTRLTVSGGAVTTDAWTLTLADKGDVVLSTGTGTKWGTATGQKQAWWNATPVVQQVLATGAGATADNIITLLQTLGLCKQA